MKFRFWLAIILSICAAIWSRSAGCAEENSMLVSAGVTQAAQANETAQPSETTSTGQVGKTTNTVSAETPTGAAQVRKTTDAVQIDPRLPVYQQQSTEVSGYIKAIGSDSMINLMLLWSDGFRNFYPDVKAEIEGKGSSTAPPALINGMANFGPMSRDWKASEIDDFENKFGYKPTTLVTSIDMLAVYVNKDCPLESLSLEQLDAIFSSTRKGGYEKEILRWGDLGLKGDWTGKPISLYGRNSASGTYQYFKDHALFGGDFKPSVAEQPGSSAVVNSISNDRYGIGYSGIGYKTPNVKALALDSGNGLVPALPENAYNGKYPMTRPLWLSINYNSANALDPLRHEFILYLFSRQGQRDVIKDGNLPITAAMAKKQLAKVGLE
ncbi:MAG TPA: phosphate ABC transporter substrate-binding protein [Pirellulales bacterium]|jgi:phosphate transport system substrate-binding protein|nr:phosphate ABC transporter substrate-binding protein [Pirellulales bacterium]